jgi:MFS-type transporter involved in bile tolerance (Atg22 family)
VVAANRFTSDVVCIVLATAAGLGIGWLDLHTTEVIVTVVPLVATGIVLGLLQPTAAWRWAALISVGLPVMAAVAKLSGMQTAEPIRLDPRVWLVALAFALLGSYAGAWARRMAHKVAGGASAPPS